MLLEGRWSSAQDADLAGAPLWPPFLYTLILVVRRKFAGHLKRNGSLGQTAHVLESTPSIISVGKRCMDMGYSFAWSAGCLPTLACPSGRTVTLDVINSVPYLPHGDTQFVCPTLDDAEPLPAMPAPGVAYRGVEANEAPICEPVLACESKSQD